MSRMKRQGLGAGVFVAVLAVAGLTAAPALAGPQDVGKSGTALAPDEIGHSSQRRPPEQHTSQRATDGVRAPTWPSRTTRRSSATTTASSSTTSPTRPRRRWSARSSAPARRTTSASTGTCCSCPPTPPAPTTRAPASPQPATIKASWEGIKIFDITDPANPRYIKSVETACGSHTHTILPSKDNTHVYVYVSSYSPNATFPDCQPPHDSISIIKVPVEAPTAAHSRRRCPTCSPTVATLAPPDVSRRRAATTSPSTRARTSRPAPAWVTASSWTSPTR